MKTTFPHHRKVLPCHPERSEGSLLHLTPVSRHENNPPSCHRFPRFDSLTSSVILRSAQDLCSEGSDCVHFICSCSSSAVCTIHRLSVPHGPNSRFVAQRSIPIHF